MTEYGCKIKEEVKATQSEIKNIYTGNQQGNETGTEINDLGQKGKINIQVEQNEETTIQKNEERLRNLQGYFRRSNIES